MKVKLIAITKPVAEDIKHFSAEEFSAYVARVSSPNNQLNSETAPKLLGYCIKHAHWSVFEHASFTVEIETSRAIAAQILRHRSFFFQERSQRYSKVSEFELYEARSQDLNNRQNSVDDMKSEDKTWFEVAQKKIWNDSNKLYKEALDRNIAKEQARFLLPLNTKTTIYMTGNIRSWITYILLREKNGTQKEHSDIANEIKFIFIEQFPSISEALKWTLLNKSDG